MKRLTLVLISILLLFSCKDNSVESLAKSLPKDFPLVSTVDTLNFGTQIPVGRIYGMVDWLMFEVDKYLEIKSPIIDVRAEQGIILTSPGITIKGNVHISGDLQVDSLKITAENMPQEIMLILDNLIRKNESLEQKIKELENR